MQHHVSRSVDPGVLEAYRLPFRGTPVGPRDPPEDLIEVEVRRREVRPVAHPAHRVQQVRPGMLLARLVPVRGAPFRAVVGPEEPHVVHLRVATEAPENEGYVDVAGDWRVVLRQVHQRRQRASRFEMLEDAVQHLGLVRPLLVLKDGHSTSKLVFVPFLEVVELLSVELRSRLWDCLRAFRDVRHRQGIPGHHHVRAGEAKRVPDAAHRLLEDLQSLP
mmetsp:Transcript_51386/g.149239  ORF Transcript_51386/g.149239 Transcript_51386/m.149239 type:complete len:219 (+) Transcript_51386:169-825(+)